MVDALSQGINAHLVQENERLVEKLEELRRLLERPVIVNLQSQDADTLHKIGQYLPQLTNIATNLSHTASAIQALQPTFERIAKALEERP